MGVSKLFKQFSKMSPEEQADFMELISKDDEESNEAEDGKQVVEQPNQEEKRVETNAKVETQPKENEKDSEVVDKTDEAIVEEQPVVNEQVNEDFEGINLSEVALKSDVKAQLDAMNAKIESILKENKDLKDELSNAKKENQDLHSKYEKGDFGNNAERNFGEKDLGKTYESADEYLKKFM